MASLLRKPTTFTKTILTTFLHHPTTTTRSFATHVINHPSSPEDSPFRVEGPPRHFMYAKMDVHPFQYEGEMDAMKCKINDEDGYAFVEVVLPGVAKDGCKLRVEKNTIWFEATAEVERQGEEPRFYKGSVEFTPPGSDNIRTNERIKANMRSGILFLRVPLVFIRGGNLNDIKE